MSGVRGPSQREPFSAYRVIRDPNERDTESFGLHKLDQLISNVFRELFFAYSRCRPSEEATGAKTWQMCLFVVAVQRLF